MRMGSNTWISKVGIVFGLLLQTSVGNSSESVHIPAEEIEIVTYHVQSLVISRYAITTVSCKIRNPTSVQKEALFSVLLPINALISNLTIFLIGCEVYLVWNQKEDLVIETFIYQLEVPITLIYVKITEDRIENVHNYTFFPSTECKEYIVMTSNITELQIIITSEMFSDRFDHLGRFVFVTSLSVTTNAPALALSNEVMKWRPNAIFLRRNYEEISGEVNPQYEIWSHDLFRANDSNSVHIVDRWTAGRLEKEKNIFPNKFNDFEGSTLTVLTFEHAPSVVEGKNSAYRSSSGILPYDGIDIRLVSAISEALNFKLNIKNPSDGGFWGSPLGNGSWSGAAGDIEQKKGHMAAANFFINSQMTEVLDFTAAYDFDEGCFVTPLPGPLPRWMSLFFPFSSKLWLLTLCSVVLGPICLFLVGKYAASTTQKDVQWLSWYGATAYYATSSFAGVSLASVPRLSVTRCFFVMWLWFGFLITTYYRSALTAFLTIPLQQTPINTVKQLLSSPLPAWGSTGLAFKKNLEGSTDPLLHQLVDRYQPVMGAKEGMELTAQRKYAMLENRQYLEYTIATNFTSSDGEKSLHVMKECVMDVRIGMILPKNAPYKPNFDQLISRIVEAGLVRKWFRDVLNANRKQFKKEAGPEEGFDTSLTIHNLEAAWLVIGFGYAASFIAFVIEIIMKTVKNIKCRRFEKLGIMKE